MSQNHATLCATARRCMLSARLAHLLPEHIRSWQRWNLWLSSLLIVNAGSVPRNPNIETVTHYEY